ncbi:MAG: chromosomal replication initiator protein DnaA [Oscillospiraceae bacterium]|nr:chromosomal replication initiator protein DnaA [Oscillospiraceae bacterium]
MNSFDSFNDVFNFVKEYCRNQMNEVAYNTWICCLEPISLSSEEAILEISSPFMKGFFEEKYLPLLKEAFAAVLGFEISVRITTKNETSSSDLKINEKKSEKTIYFGEYEYVFDTFIVGNSNKFAHAAAQAVALNPSGAYNPLFIYGESGLGKTHLLCAIRSEIRKNNPDSNVIYVKGEDFTNEIIEAIGKNTTQEFRRKYRLADVLLVDDIQFIAGKDRTQDEFFQTFEALYGANKQIVLASDRPPKEIKTLEERLRSRFEWGLLADIQPPDYETRIAILKRKAELMNVSISNDICDFICSKVKNNIRQIEGIVKKLKALQSYSSNNVITMGIAQNALRDIMSDAQSAPITCERIINEVARTFDVSPQDIRSLKRNGPISSARQAAMYIIREITGMPMSDIGAEFGGRNHSTVVYSNELYRKKIEEDSKLREITEDIIRNIKEQ